MEKIKSWVANGNQDVTDAWERDMEDIDEKLFLQREKAHHHVITLKAAREALVSSTAKIRELKSFIGA